MAEQQNNLQSIENGRYLLINTRILSYASDPGMFRIRILEKTDSGFAEGGPDAYIRHLEKMVSRPYDKVMYLGKTRVYFPADIPGRIKEDKFKYILLRLLDSAGDVYTKLAEGLRKIERNKRFKRDTWETILVEIWVRNIYRVTDFYLDPVRTEELVKQGFSPQDEDFCMEVIDIGRAITKIGTRYNQNIHNVLSWFIFHVNLLQRCYLCGVHNRLSELSPNQTVASIPIEFTDKMLDDHRYSIINLEKAVSELTLVRDAPSNQITDYRFNDSDMLTVAEIARRTGNTDSAISKLLDRNPDLGNGKKGDERRGSLLKVLAHYGKRKTAKTMKDVGWQGRNAIARIDRFGK